MIIGRGIIEYNVNKQSERYFIYDEPIVPAGTKKAIWFHVYGYELFTVVYGYFW